MGETILDKQIAIVRAAAALTLSGAILAACNGGSDSPSNASLPSMSRGGVQPNGERRPAGLVGPVTIGSGDLFPAPYDPVTSGYVPRRVNLHPTFINNDPMFERHLQAVLAHSKLIRDRATGHVRPDDTVSADDTGGQGGYYLGLSGAVQGDGSIWAAQDAIAPDAAYNVSLPGPNDSFGNYLYAPTTHGANGNCMETVTEYSDTDGTGTQYNLMIWNFCQSQNGAAQEVQIPMNTDFFDDYVEIYANGDQRPQYSEEVYVDSSGSWHQLLYNNLLKKYDDVYDLSGTSDVNNKEGWSLFETHFSSGITCPALPTIGMSGLRTRINGVWEYVTESPNVSFGMSQSQDCFNSSAPPYYTINPYAPDYAWTEYDPSTPEVGAGVPTPKPVPTPVHTPPNNCSVTDGSSPKITCP